MFLRTCAGGGLEEGMVSPTDACVGRTPLLGTRIIIRCSVHCSPRLGLTVAREEGLDFHPTPFAPGDSHCCPDRPWSALLTKEEHVRKSFLEAVGQELTLERKQMTQVEGGPSWQGISGERPVTLPGGMWT